MDLLMQLQKSFVRRLVIFSAVLMSSAVVDAVVDQMGVDVKAAEKNKAKFLNEDELPEFVQLDTVTVSIIKDGRVVAYLQVEIELEAHDAKGSEKLTLALPFVHHAILMDLHGAMNALWVTNTDPSVPSIKKRIERVVEKKLREDIIKVINVRKVFLQRLEG